MYQYKGESEVEDYQLEGYQFLTELEKLYTSDF
jgi:hypothetical protein